MLTGKPRPSVGTAASGTVAWLIERYRETDAWRSLSASTRHKREQILRQAVKTAGNVQIGAITPAKIKEGRERRAHTPGQATHFLYAMRGLFRWALDAQMVKTDPTVGIKNPPRRRGSGYRPWTEDDVAAYERRRPIGTRNACGSMCCYTRGSAAVMPYGSADSTSATAWRRLKRRKLAQSSRFRSCLCWLQL